MEEETRGPRLSEKRAGRSPRNPGQFYIVISALVCPCGTSAVRHCTGPFMGFVFSFRSTCSSHFSSVIVEEFQYPADLGSFVIASAWDRRFGDGPKLVRYRDSEVDVLVLGGRIRNLSAIQLSTSGSA
jgi:hypothetical protein